MPNNSLKWNFKNCKLFVNNQCRSPGEQGEGPSSEIEKMLKKNDGTLDGSIFSINFSKNSLKLNFPIEFSSKIYKIFSKHSQQFVFFVQSLEKLTQVLLSFV